MSAVDGGLKSLDTSVSSQCAAAVDNLAGFYFKATHTDTLPTQSPPHPAAQVAFPFASSPPLHSAHHIRVWWLTPCMCPIVVKKV